MITCITDDDYMGSLHSSDSILALSNYHAELTH